MALKDSFINLNKALRTTLQNVPAVVDTLIRGFDEIGDAADEQSTYSTTEKVVGTWIDGSKLYESVVELGALPNSTGASYEHHIANIDKIIYLNGSAVDTSGAMLPIPYLETNKNIGVWANRTLIAINAQSDRRTFNGIITLRYTKTTANRAPEDNDTKNVIDDEPVVKTVVEPAEDLKK